MCTFHPKQSKNVLSSCLFAIATHHLQTQLNCYSMGGKGASDQKREQKLRNKGRSIMDAAVTRMIPLGSLKNIQSKFRGEISPELRAKAITLWPFVVECCESQKKNNPTPEAWADGFCQDTTPEMEIFWWECLVLSIIHALELMTIMTKDNGKGHAVDEAWREAWRILPVLPLRVLQDESTLDLFRQVPMDMRKTLYLHVFMLMNGSGKKDGVMPSDEAAAVIAVAKVRGTRNEEFERLQKLKEIRYGERFGAACASCRVVGTKHKKCSRCAATYYCGADCQRSHWKAHKKSCSPQDKEVAAELAEKQGKAT